MHHVPTGSFLLLVVFDLGLVLIMSTAYGVVVARADARPAWLGAVGGLVVPLAGPLIWAVVAAVRTKGLVGTERAGARSPAASLAAALSVVAAGLFVVALPLPWAAVSGRYESYALATDSTPADTGVGLVITVVSAVLMVVVALTAVFTTSRVRTSMVAGLVGGLWLIVTTDGLIVFGALADLGDAADGLSSGRASVEAAPAAALWLCLVAGALALGVGVLLLLPVAGAVGAPAGIPAGARLRAEVRTETGQTAATAWGRPSRGSASSADSTLGRADDGWAVDDGWR